ncbi:MAG: preprotein translocase subunit YajC [Treponema sp.]|nr:preprotein translocase subunit YajC [Treponema sp.]
MFFSLLQTSGNAAQGGGSMLMTVLPFILIIAIFYFFIIRPQNKKQKETEKMINALKKGDKVVTIGGIHGVVSSTKEKTVIVKVDDNTKLEFNRSAIATVVTDKPAAPAKNVKKAKAEEKAEEAPKAAEAEPEADAEKK